MKKWNLNLFLNSSDNIIKVQTMTVNIELIISKYSSFCMGDFKLNNERFNKYIYSCVVHSNCIVKRNETHY